MTCIKAFAQQGFWKIESPNGDLKLEISIDKEYPSYSVIVHNEKIIDQAKLDIQLSKHDQILALTNVNQVKTEQHNKIVTPLIQQKSAQIKDHYTMISLSFDAGVLLEFRAYNEGFAYRLVLPQNFQGQIVDEMVKLNFTQGAEIYAPIEQSFYSHNERSYLKTPLNQLSNKQLMSLPFLVQTSSHKIVVTESGLENYAGLWFYGSESNSLIGAFPKKVSNVTMKEKSDRNQVIRQRENFIADIELATTRTLPWRIFAISRDDKALLENQLSFLLAPKQRIADGSWIKPGKVAWDWWNANNLYNVDFEAGLNTKTYKYFIDFAADYGLEYIILDEGWYQLGNALDIVPDIDVKYLINYAQEKGVGVILWVVWKTIEDDLSSILSEYAQWGAKGIKVDFMQRDDQDMVNYYWQVAEEAAKHKLLVNFHGSYKPAGLRRAYPNVITREGVRGLEHNKWANYITSKHNLTLPFIRMVAGPMDYTPGAMTNVQPKHFNISFERPMSQTTRAHQVALYVLFESPLQMLADSPSQYIKEAETTRFIAAIPTVWDETHVISAKIGEHVIIARRYGNSWFLAGVGDHNEQTFQITPSFLDAGQYEMTVYSDGLNANRFASDFKISSQTVHAKSPINMQLKKNGGWVARFDKLKHN